ncbi:hypothetical protein BAY61_22435 [Prauserella marina]|uniref:Uncharacterized protein n=1 Tax=Prauserella marina TaxID=530584 RepID=A0A222VTR3_9PSEU|nr:hypothetical protein [Prauserella marina]ASR37299.1 hypothetical protein BAY61_22435 [Prauserella marina]PWV74850.1 hypothetical protein DES30_107248 [Prauserella marina]SDD39085.1 hypothetical protein SAMN05421630_1083 [Prauserella marina]
MVSYVEVKDPAVAIAGASGLREVGEAMSNALEVENPVFSDATRIDRALAENYPDAEITELRDAIVETGESLTELAQAVINACGEYGVAEAESTEDIQRVEIPDNVQLY